jgi:RHS repeat-associated protein
MRRSTWGARRWGVLKQSGSAAASTLQVVAYNVWADHIATPRVVTRGSDQAIVWRWDASEPFGATAADQNPSALGTFAFNQRFPGQVFDAETGNFQNWHRDYKANIGRYAQSDPIGLQGGINTFAYVGGNPVSGFDLLGLLCNWAQGSGVYSCYDYNGDYYASGKGYAGRGTDKDSPGSQNIYKRGPLPRGCYKVAGIEDQPLGTGPYSLRLTPLFKNYTTNDNRDLYSFLIHDDKTKDPGNASDGCPILPPQDRMKIPLGETFCVN